MSRSRQNTRSRGGTRSKSKSRSPPSRRRRQTYRVMSKKRPIQFADHPADISTHINLFNPDHIVFNPADNVEYRNVDFAYFPDFFGGWERLHPDAFVHTVYEDSPAHHWTFSFRIRAGTQFDNQDQIHGDVVMKGLLQEVSSANGFMIQLDCLQPKAGKTCSDIVVSDPTTYIKYIVHVSYEAGALDEIYILIPPNEDDDEGNEIILNNIVRASSVFQPL